MRFLAHRLRTLLGACALVVVAGLLTGCSSMPDMFSSKDETASWSADKLYSEARLELSSGNWSKAREYYQKLESRYPFGRHAQQAQMEIAYSYYKEGESAQAIQAADRFIRLYPNHPNVDYVYYLKGLASFNDDLGLLGRLTTQDLAERDAKAAREAFDSMRDLVTRFPDSKYASDARARMRYLVNTLARSEVKVAEYYYSRKAFLAAIQRAQSVIRDFQNAPAVEDALVVLVRSYRALGMADLEADAARVLAANFPANKTLAAR